MAYIIDGVEYSPCICAKAKIALGIATSSSGNNKKCSGEYWTKVVKHFGKLHNLDDSRIQRAIKREDLYR